jgi:2-polyprenyl-3-methyl-5-hydroxy-6-metoxy-1,4-benzoquinol methylase
MNLSKILNNAYQLALLAKGLECEIWNTREIIGFDNIVYETVNFAWEQEGWLDEPALSSIINQKDFILYEYMMFSKQLKVLNSENIVWGIYTNPDDYEQLRRGLVQYANENIKSTFEGCIVHLELPEFPIRVMDIGGGNGQYCDYFKNIYPQTNCTVVDKVWPAEDSIYNHARVKVDFIKSKVDWIKGHSISYNVVMLNEILHCKSEAEQQDLIHTAWLLLKKGGYLIVVDQSYSHQFNLRMAMLTQNGGILNQMSFQNLVKAGEPSSLWGPFLVTDVDDRHWITILKKRG